MIHSSEPFQPIILSVFNQVESSEDVCRLPKNGREQTTFLIHDRFSPFDVSFSAIQHGHPLPFRVVEISDIYSVLNSGKDTTILLQYLGSREVNTEIISPLSKILNSSDCVSFISFSPKSLTENSATLVPINTSLESRFSLSAVDSPAIFSRLPSSVWTNGSLWRSSDLLPILASSETQNEFEGLLAGWVERNAEKKPVLLTVTASTGGGIPLISEQAPCAVVFSPHGNSSASCSASEYSQDFYSSCDSSEKDVLHFRWDDCDTKSGSEEQQDEFSPGIHSARELETSLLSKTISRLNPNSIAFVPKSVDFSPTLIRQMYSILRSDPMIDCIAYIDGPLEYSCGSSTSRYCECEQQSNVRNGKYTSLMLSRKAWMSLEASPTNQNTTESYFSILEAVHSLGLNTVFIDRRDRKSHSETATLAKIPSDHSASLGDTVDFPSFHQGADKSIQIKSKTNLTYDRRTVGDHPLVSIIISTHNRPLLVTRAINSVLRQEMDDVEVIVVNDGDKPLDPKIERIDSRIRIFSTGMMRGPGAARNIGLNNSRGRFIGFLDDDDLLFPNHLSTLLSTLNKSNASVAYANALRRWEPHGQVIRRDNPYTEQFSADELLFRNITPIQTVLFSRSLIDQGLRFDENLIRGEDWDFWARMSDVYDFKKIDTATSEFSWRFDGSTMTSSWRAPFDWAELIVLARHAPRILSRPHLINRFVVESHNHLYRLVKEIESEPHGFVRRLGTGDLTVLKSHFSEIKSSFDHHDELMKQLTQLIELDLAFCSEQERSDHESKGSSKHGGLVVEALTPPSVSIILPLYNACHFTEHLLEELVSPTEKTSYEIIAVDNHSSDGTRDILNRYSRSIRSILNDTNRNFSGACNQGAAAAKAEYLLFLNNDVEVFPGWLDEMVTILKENEDVAVVGNLQFYPGCERVHHAGMCFNEYPYPIHYLEGIDSSDPRILKDRIVQCVTGSCLLIRANVFRHIGGFDEGYRNGYEDVDLCLKVGGLGHKIMYSSRSSIIHHVSRSPGRNRWGVENERKFFERWGRSLRSDIEVLRGEDTSSVSSNEKSIHPQTVAVFACPPWCDPIQFTFVRSLCRSIRRSLGQFVNRADLPRLLVPSSVATGQEDLWISRYDSSHRVDWEMFSKHLLDLPHANIYLPIIATPHLLSDNDFLSFLSQSVEYPGRITIITDSSSTALDSCVEELAPTVRILKVLGKTVSLGHEVETDLDRCWWHLNIEGKPRFQVVVCNDRAEDLISALSIIDANYGPVFMYRDQGIWSDDDISAATKAYSTLNGVVIAGLLDGRLPEVRLFSMLICASMVSYMPNVDPLLSPIIEGLRNTTMRDSASELQTLVDEITGAILDLKVDKPILPAPAFKANHTAHPYQLDPRILLRF